MKLNFILYAVCFSVTIFAQDPAKYVDKINANELKEKLYVYSSRAITHKPPATFYWG